MDLQRMRRLKASVQAVKLYLESLPLSSPRCLYPITKHRTLEQNYSHGNDQQLTCSYNNGRDLLVRDWNFQQNAIQKRRKHTSSRKCIHEIAFENDNLQGFRSYMNNNYCLTRNELVPATVDRRHFLVIHKSILLVRYYSKLVPKVEKWRSKDKKNRRQLAKLVDCVPGNSNNEGGGFFKNIFGNLFGWNSSANAKCKPCRKQRGSSSKLTESKQKGKKEKADEDDCDVDINGEKAKASEKSPKKVNKAEDDCDLNTSSAKSDKNVTLAKKVSKTKDDCDVKSDKQDEMPENVIKTGGKCASNTHLERADESCAKSSKKSSKTDSSASICHQTSNRMKPSNSSCNPGASSDRLKQLDTLEKCIGTLQQLIKNLKLEEEMKRATKKDACKPIICPEPKKVVCPEPKKPACPEPKKPVCPEPVKPACPEPKKPACPEPEKPICPVPTKPVCPEPFKKPACPQPKKPACPETQKHVCPEPKKPVCPEPKKPVCPEPKKSDCPEPKKPVCSEPEKPICSEENTNQDGGEKSYKCGIIEDINPPKRRYGRQKLRDKNDKYSHCGKENSKHGDEQCSQKVKNCTDADESKNDC